MEVKEVTKTTSGSMQILCHSSKNVNEFEVFTYKSGKAYFQAVSIHASGKDDPLIVKAIELIPNGSRSIGMLIDIREIIGYQLDCCDTEEKEYKG